MPVTKMRRQTVNFLGFLRGQLNGLQGIPTLCYELIQNADDVKDESGNPGSSKITFDVCDDALYVYNDGVFREIDFERMEKVSWGNKREEEGTTGAFGLGFISVYQITDSPEIFSSGRHWQFIPNGHEDERIRETLMDTQETKFRLPWAFDESEVRKELGILPIKKDALTSYTLQINRSIESAALFLKQVNVLELKRNGELIRKIETVRENAKLLLADGKKTIVWRIFEGDFNDQANEMRREYGENIESKRQSIVKIAVPDDPQINGLLYAFLPSETNTGLPFHINADFYPTQDRKRIIFGEDYKSSWNNHAIRCAAEALSQNCEELLEIFTNPQFWEFAEKVKKASQSNDYSPEFPLFWDLLKPEIKKNRAVLTSSQKVVFPNEAIFLDTQELTKAEKIFEDLGLKISHVDLRSQQNILLETGVQNLRVEDICDSFEQTGFTQKTELARMPVSLRSKEGWNLLWKAIDHLWTRYPVDQHQVIDRLKNIPIAFGTDGNLWPLDELFIADGKSRDFFSKISNIVWYQEKSTSASFLNELIPHFKLEDGVHILTEEEELFPELWNEGLYSPKELLEWLETNRFEINNPIAQQIRELSIWPTADGELKPLCDLFLAGDFEDPLKLAKLVDIDALGGGRDFLERVLSVTKLDFITYVKEWVPFIFNQRELKVEEKLKLIQILAENLGKLRDYQDIRTAISELSIVWCGSEEFYPATYVWFDSKDIRDILGSEIKIAQLPKEKSESIEELYIWLGVSSEPEPKDIVNRIKKIIVSPPNPENIQLIGRMIDFISSKWFYWNDEQKEQFESLRNVEWLPGIKANSKWFDPQSVYSIYSDFLFKSQGNFLVFGYKAQQDASEFFRFLGIESQPSPDQVVRHILFSSQNATPVTLEVYGYLNDKERLDDPSIDFLKGQKCLCLKNPDGDDEYFSPDQVFWEQHSFGKYRYRLSPDYGRFKPLFDRIGVKEKPDVNDAIQVLLEISSKFGSSNIPMTNNADEEEILIMCWKLISLALDGEEISKSEIKKKLGNKKTIPDSRKILTKPEMMFFEDRPGWGEKFKIVKNNLTPRIEGVWLSMEAAGVRPLSTVINTEMVTCKDRTENEEFLSLLLERKDLLLRVIEEHRNQGIKELSITGLSNLAFYNAEKIDIVRTFNGFGRQETSEIETVDAILVDESLYIEKQNGSYPWKGISRELSYVVNSTGELRSLGMELKEILSQPLEEARKTLDELGYPMVEVVETKIDEGQTLEPGSEEEELGGLRVGVDFPEAGKQTSGVPSDNGKGTEPKTEGGSGASTSSRTKATTDGTQEKRKTSRLRSYVYPEGAVSTKQEDGSLSQKRSAVAEKGVERVMQFEREQNRTPKDMEKVQVHHPGYDIESKDNDGNLRYIEVKSLSGTWDSQNPAELTRTEFETAKKKGEDFWLYIVERAQSDDFIIYQIQDPGNRVDYYLYDHGWVFEREESQ